MRKLAFCALLGLGLGGCQPLVQIEATSGGSERAFDPPAQNTVFANYDRSLSAGFTVSDQPDL